VKLPRLLSCAALLASCGPTVTSTVVPETGELRVVEVRDGRRDGRAQVFDHRGLLREESHFAGGVLDGIHASWHDNGQKRGECRYAGGRRDGPERGWHANGQLAFEGQWTAGDRTGRWIWYAEDGRPAREEHWEGGTQVSVRELVPEDGG
jgi:antitoxin component YwqK of YwqJK toxin-antitoxin module